MRASAVLALLALAGCHGRAETTPAAASAAAAPEPTALPSARRPLRRYYLERATVDRCEIYSETAVTTGDTPVPPDSVSPRTPTPCPVDLQVGEKIRIAGKTCARVSGDPARALPVVCPDPLTNLEKRDLAARAP